MDLRSLETLNRVAYQALGDWWQDERRNWCAYCGVEMFRWCGKGSMPPSQATRDHVISRAHRGGCLTIPACRACNEAKGSRFLAEFLDSDYLKTKRKSENPHCWPIEALWAVAGISAIRTALNLSVSAGSAKVSDFKADHIL
ncbi:MAG: hypothetical protein KF874_07735 [Rhizobiaceae bacterium]|nr:hypothetical protein [Rhizobiaceae bacterium]